MVDQNNEKKELNLHSCTQQVSTPDESVRLGGHIRLKENIRTQYLGISDHTLGNLACFRVLL